MAEHHSHRADHRSHRAGHHSHRILFVCTGNICRSPTAEAVLRRMVDERGLSSQIDVDSAGVSNYHDGEHVDHRSAAVAQDAGYNMQPIRSRMLLQQDFQDFDLIVAMANDHLSHMRAMAEQSSGDAEQSSSDAEQSSGDAEQSSGHARLKLFMDFIQPSSSLDVPDPYYGGDQGFIQVLQQIEKGCQAILDDLQLRL